MRIWKMLGLGLLLATVWVTPGWTQSGGRMHGDVLGFGPLLRALTLTESQHAQVHDALTTYRTTVQPLWRQMRTARQQLTDVLVSATPLDPSALQTAEQQLASLHDQLLQARVTLAEAVRGVLTPDQLTQAAQLKDQLRSLQTTRQQLLAPQAQP
jgi:periplasmic protein CpxP/Spy